MSGLGSRIFIADDLAIDDYTELRPVGSGEYANVFKAKDCNGDPVALKVLKKQYLGNDAVYKDFFAEEQVLSKLADVSHIVQIKVRYARSEATSWDIVYLKDVHARCRYFRTQRRYCRLRIHKF